MDFVDDVDFEAAVCRADGAVLPQLSHLVDAAVTGGVDLHDVHVLTGQDGQALLTGIAGLTGHAVGALDRFGIDSRSACLAHPPGASEEIGMANPARLNRAGESTGHVLLPHQFVEPLRAIAAGHHLVALHSSGSGPGVGGY